MACGIQLRIPCIYSHFCNSPLLTYLQMCAFQRARVHLALVHARIDAHQPRLACRTCPPFLRCSRRWRPCYGSRHSSCAYETASHALPWKHELRHTFQLSLSRCLCQLPYLASAIAIEIHLQRTGTCCRRVNLAALAKGTPLPMNRISELGISRNSCVIEQRLQHRTLSLIYD